MKHLPVFLLLLSVTNICGCSLFISREKDPVLPETLAPGKFGKAIFGTLSLTPDRRIVLANFDTKRFCAEAPSDIGLNLADSISALASVNVKSDVAASIAGSLASQSNDQVLNAHTQGLMLFLANSYFICQMYMNNAIDEKAVLTIQIAAFNAAYNLIEAEIPYLHPTTITVKSSSGDTSSATPAAPSTPTAPQTPKEPTKPQAPTTPPVTVEPTSGNNTGNVTTTTKTPSAPLPAVTTGKGEDAIDRTKLMEDIFPNNRP